LGNVTEKTYLAHERRGKENIKKDHGELDCDHVKSVEMVQGRAEEHEFVLNAKGQVDEYPLFEGHSVAHIIRVCM
jgi:hypothetical protein